MMGFTYPYIMFIVVGDTVTQTLLGCGSLIVNLIRLNEYKNIFEYLNN